MSNKMTRVLDVLSVVLSVGMVGLAAVWMLTSGAFNLALTDQQNASWYLIRALGITGYVLITISMAWGIVLSSRMVKDWSPGPLSMLLHSTVSWLGLILGFGHAALLMVDKYFAYNIGDILIPFTGPYRPIEVGLGTLAFWILLIVTPSFALRKRLFSHRAWQLLHYSSYAAFLLVTLHGLLAGTDGTHLGFRLLLGISVLTTSLLLAYRIRTRRKAVPDDDLARVVEGKSPATTRTRHTTTHPRHQSAR
jgi:sulfoxide reductase heme-binding subunit YedZ